MPRGQRKSLEEKIQAKQELINALNIRIESEERELEELFEQKRRKRQSGKPVPRHGPGHPFYRSP